MFFRKTTFSLVTARFMRLARSLIVYPILPEALGIILGLKDFSALLGGYGNRLRLPGPFRKEQQKPGKN
jgi:hypothetical protein